MKIYVASSWRNPIQPDVVKALRDAKHEVYDFRNPHDGYGFQWAWIDEGWQRWTPEQFKLMLNHPIANKGFKLDWDAMEWADCGVLVMPCGRSAHLEAGYFVGAKKNLVILTNTGEPELMYKMADEICLSIPDLVDYLTKDASSRSDERAAKAKGGNPP